MGASGNDTNDYARRLGARIFSEANDLKRTPEALAAELGWDFADVQRIIEGNADPDQAKALLTRMCETYPVSLADLWLDADDTDAGVVVMTAAASAASSRIFERKAGDGALTSYYEYRDTAMSRAAPYRPEWIKQLRHVEDSDPDNRDVAFNNGHLMHQLTFFIGEVNFYWSTGGKKFCREMNTGDSAYITPFVPHSFTSRNRDPGRLGLIIAVTYGGNVRRAAASLSRLSIEQVDTIAGDMRNAALAFKARVTRIRENESLSIGALAERLVDDGTPPDRARALAAGDDTPTVEELSALGAALAVKPGDLWIIPLADDDEVAITHRGDGSGRLYPDTNAPFCELSELARSPHQPGQRGFDVVMLGTDADTTGPGFMHHLHEYMFNYGDQPVELIWGDGRRAVLAPGDSAYVRPTVEHWLQGPAGARLVVSRVAGQLVDEVFDEFATFATDGRRRALMETKRWF